MFSNECLYALVIEKHQPKYLYTCILISLFLSLSLSNEVTYLNTEWLLVIIHTIYRTFNCVNSNRNHSKCALLWICDHLFDSSKMKFTYRGLKCRINNYVQKFTLCQKWSVIVIIFHYHFVVVLIKKRFAFLSKIHSKKLFCR